MNDFLSMKEMNPEQAEQSEQARAQAEQEAKLRLLFTGDVEATVIPVLAYDMARWKREEAIVKFLQDKSYRQLFYLGKPVTRVTFPAYIKSITNLEGYKKTTIDGIEHMVDVKNFLAENFAKYTNYPTNRTLCTEMRRWIKWGDIGEANNKRIFKLRFSTMWKSILDVTSANAVTVKMFNEHCAEIFVADLFYEADVLYERDVLYETDTGEHKKGDVQHKKGDKQHKKGEAKLTLDSYFTLASFTNDEERYLQCSVIATIISEAGTTLDAKEQAVREQAAKDAETLAAKEQALAATEQAKKDAETLAATEQAKKDAEALAATEQAKKDAEALAATELELKKLVQQLEETSKRMREDSDLSETLIRQIKILKKW